MLGTSELPLAAQGVGGQRDAIDATVEQTRLASDLVTLERDRRTLQARLNALVGRAPGSPLAAPEGLRPVPDGAALEAGALIDRAREQNPRLAAAAAEISAADATRELAGKSWYPDVVLGVGGMDRVDGPPAYSATIGVRVPLQWGVRRAQEREATAKAGAARSRLSASTLEIQSGLEEALQGLRSAQRMEGLLRDELRPQIEAAYRSALALYQQGRGDLAAVLAALRRTQEMRLEGLKARVEQQASLAEIERLTGGEL